MVASWQHYGTYDESAHPDLWNGVVGYWAPCLGPTGLRLHDVSRYGNWGTLTNMDAASDWVIDGGQYALDFDGSNDLVSAASLPDFPTDCAWSAWGYVYAGDTGGDIMLIRTTTVFGGAARNGVSLIMRDGFSGTFLDNVAAEITIGTTRHRAASNSGISRETWTMITGVRRAGVLYLYVNGVRQTATANVTTTITNEAATSFGKVPDYTPTLCRSRGDDWIVWNRSLTDNEVARLYQFGRGGMLQRKPRRRAYSMQAGFRAHYATQRNAQLIGGGLR
jgi:hypothetical protein